MKYKCFAFRILVITMFYDPHEIYYTFVKNFLSLLWFVFCNTLYKNVRVFFVLEVFPVNEEIV